MCKNDFDLHENVNVGVQTFIICMDHREKTEVPDRLAVKDLIGYKLNKDENKQGCDFVNVNTMFTLGLWSSFITGS